jgi:hypothetical protein
VGELTEETFGTAMRMHAESKYPQAADAVLELVGLHARPLLQDSQVPSPPPYAIDDDIARLVDAHQGALQSVFVAVGRLRSFDLAVNSNATVTAAAVIAYLRAMDVVPSLITPRELRPVRMPLGWSGLALTARVCVDSAQLQRGAHRPGYGSS